MLSGDFGCLLLSPRAISIHSQHQQAPAAGGHWTGPRGGGPCCRVPRLGHEPLARCCSSCQTADRCASAVLCCTCTVLAGPATAVCRSRFPGNLAVFIPGNSGMKKSGDPGCPGNGSPGMNSLLACHSPTLYTMLMMTNDGAAVYYRS